MGERRLCAISLCNWKSPQRALPSHPGHKARGQNPRGFVLTLSPLPLTQHFPPGESSVGKLLPAQPRLSFPVGSAAPGSLWALTPSAHLTFLAHESRAVPTVYSERVWITLFTFPWVSRDFCFRRHIPSSLPLALITRCPRERFSPSQWDALSKRNLPPDRRGF